MPTPKTPQRDRGYGRDHQDHSAHDLKKHPEGMNGEVAVPSVRILRERLQIGKEEDRSADGEQNRNRAGAYRNPNASGSHDRILATRTPTRKAGKAATYNAGISGAPQRRAACR